MAVKSPKRIDENDNVINKEDMSFFTVMDCVKDVYGKKVEEVTNA